MKALLKSGEWVEIDTKYLFHDQYNTTEDKRIFDREIVRIVDDVRNGLGRCRYCGAMVRRGEEEKHFQEKESRGCAGCFWLRDRVIDREVKTEVQRDGDEKTTVKITVERLESVCSYAEKYPESGCTLKECRKMGIDWFTPENTFFLRYPDGFSSIPKIDLLPQRGFVLNNRRLNAEYYKKIGSYTLVANFSYQDGKPKGVEYYRLWNCRRSFNFRFEGGLLFCDRYAMGWRQVKTLEGVPAAVMQAVKAICNR